MLSWSKIRETLVELRAFWRDLTGESAYERYLEHQKRNHPNAIPMTAKEFWRERSDYAEQNPSTGCC